MKKLIVLFALVGTLAVVTAICVQQAIGVGEGQKSVSATTSPASNGSPQELSSRAPIVVELFTSEGCSSCPPADNVLSRLDSEQPIAGAQIIALSQHVDYWNDLGWRDPFSAAGFSERQREYAGVLHSRGVYTPQMVVDGQYEFVGSSMTKAREAIARAAQSPKAVVQVQLDRVAGEAAAGHLRFKVTVDNLRAVKRDGSADVLLAVTESNLRSSVSNGENAGRRLVHSAVVRQLRVIGNLEVKAQDFTAEPAIAFDRGWKREDLRVVVFVQERASRRIIGAGVAPLAN